MLIMTSIVRLLLVVPACISHIKQYHIHIICRGRRGEITKGLTIPYIGLCMQGQLYHDIYHILLFLLALPCVSSFLVPHLAFQMHV